MIIKQEKNEYIVQVSKDELLRLYDSFASHLEERGGAVGKDKVLLDTFQSQLNTYLTDKEKWDHCTETDEWMDNYSF